MHHQDGVAEHFWSDLIVADIKAKHLTGSAEEDHVHVLSILEHSHLSFSVQTTLKFHNNMHSRYEQERVNHTPTLTYAKCGEIIV